MRDKNTDRREDVGPDQGKENEWQTGRSQIDQALAGRHPHFQQEQAQRPLEQCQEQRVVSRGDLLSLESSHKSNDDSAKQQE